MASTPYPIGLTINQPSGTIRSNIQVTCRNEGTNESKILNTDSNGQVIFNLGDTEDFQSGWSPGVAITCFSLYQGFQQSFSFTIPDRNSTSTVKDDSGITVGTARSFGLTGTMILVAVPTSPSLKLFTIQEFLDQYNLKTTDQDSENGVKVQQIIKIGQGVEKKIESDTNTKFDSNSGNYYTGANMEGGESPEYHDVKFSTQNLFWAKFIPINSVSKFEISTTSEGQVRVWRDIKFDSVDNMASTTDWGATTDGSVTLNSTPAEVSNGDTAINLVKSGATVAAVTYSKTFSSQFSFSSQRVFSVDYYIEDNTDLASSDGIEIRFGSDSSNYYSKKYDRNDIASAAYTTLSFQKNDSDVTATGTPSVEAMEYFAIIVTTVASSTTIAAPDQRLDDLRLGARDVIKIDKITGRVKIANITLITSTTTTTSAISRSFNLPRVGARQVRITYKFGRSSVPFDINQLAIMDTGMRMFGFAFLKSKFNNFNAVDIGDVSQLNQFRNSVIRRYINHGFLPT